MFKRIDDLMATNGVCLQEYVDEVNLLALVAHFGKPEDGYWDPEKGYDGHEFLFVEESTGEVVNLYSRFGNWRIGAHSKDVAQRFKAWLLAQLPVAS